MRCLAKAQYKLTQPQTTSPSTTVPGKTSCWSTWGWRRTRCCHRDWCNSRPGRPARTLQGIRSRRPGLAATPSSPDHRWLWCSCRSSTEPSPANIRTSFCFPSQPYLMTNQVIMNANVNILILFKERTQTPHLLYVLWFWSTVIRIRCKNNPSFLPQWWLNRRKLDHHRFSPCTHRWLETNMYCVFHLQNYHFSYKLILSLQGHHWIDDQCWSKCI